MPSPIKSGRRHLKTNGPAIAEKWKLAQEKARRTATWARTMTKVIISQNNSQAPFWHVVNFLGPGKCEPRGIVDLLAVRKNQGEHALPLKRGDCFDMILIQVKGGSAKRPSAEERERLRSVAKIYGAKTILLSEWKKGSKAVLCRLDGDEWSSAIDPAEVFGPRSKPGKKPRTKPEKNGKVMASAASKAWATRKARLHGDA